jgi:protein SCO1
MFVIDNSKRMEPRRPTWAHHRMWVHPLAAALAFALIAASLSLAFPTSAQLSDPNQNIGVRPELLRNVGIDQKLNDSIPLGLAFRDEAGNPVELRQFFGHGPVILTLVYYNCPMLCTQVLNSLNRSLKEIPMDVGKQFRVVTISIDPAESHVLASAKHEVYTGIYGRPGGAEGWHFLTGDEPNIKQLASAVGFRYAYDPGSKQFAHASAIFVLTPEGRLSRYFYGIEYPPRDLRLGLVEASAGKIGSPVDQLLLFCYHYDPHTGKYGWLITRLVRAAGVFTMLAIGFLILILRRGERYALPRVVSRKT